MLVEYCFRRLEWSGKRVLYWSDVKLFPVARKALETWNGWRLKGGCVGYESCESLGGRRDALQKSYSSWESLAVYRFDVRNHPWCLQEPSKKFTSSGDVYFGGIILVSFGLVSVWNQLRRLYKFFTVMIARYPATTEHLRTESSHRGTWTLLFERSEFLIATFKKKKTDSLCVCGCSSNLGFSVEKNVLVLV